jgi:isopenicillin N synthase-like dioxygenase
MSAIPVLDLSQAASVAGKARLVQELRQACLEAGFFYVINHGVSADLVRSAYAQTALLFDAPMPDKMAIHLSHSTCRRGYERIGDQTLDENALPDQKESYYCGVDYPADHPYVLKGYDTYGQSQWPSWLPTFKSVMDDYIAAHQALCERLMGYIALSLGEPETYFEKTLIDPMITLRLLRYPPHPQQADQRLFGAGAHTDWGALTTLAQDETGGLQVQMPSGTWVDAPPIKDSFVVNLGDMMPRWTNDLYRSNPHRVINKSHHQARYSIPFFYEPNYEAPIDPIASTVTEQSSRKYKTITAGEHLKYMVEKTYGKNISAG